jgi:hypothetical protein
MFFHLRDLVWSIGIEELAVMTAICHLDIGFIHKLHSVILAI